MSSMRALFLLGIHSLPFTMVVFVAFLSAFVTRLLFCVHGVFSVWLVVCYQDNNKYWGLLAGVVFMIGETTYTMIFRKGEEFKKFWPCRFFYLMTIIPVILVMEVDLLNHRIRVFNKGKDYSLYVDWIRIDAQIGRETMAKKVCELGLVILVILARLLLPRGRITYSQLSSLFLGYAGMGADILELVESFREPEVTSNTTMTYVVLAIFIWGLLQFTLVSTVIAAREHGRPQGQSNRREAVMFLSKVKPSLDVQKGVLGFQFQKSSKDLPSAVERGAHLKEAGSPRRLKQGSVQLAPLPRDGLSRHVGMTKVRRGKIRPRRMKRANFTKQPNVPASTTALHFYSNKLTLDESDTYVWEPTIQARTGRNGNIKASTKQRPLISIGQNEWKRSKYWDKGKRRTSTAYSSKKDYSIAAQESTNPKMIFKRTFRNFTISDHLLGILIAIFMHDGPFLILRLVLLIYFDVRSQIHLFFACKNATNLALMTYRLSHLLFSECKDEVEDENDQSFKLRNVQRAVMGTETLKSV